MLYFLLRGNNNNKQHKNIYNKPVEATLFRDGPLGSLKLDFGTPDNKVDDKMEDCEFVALSGPFWGGLTASDVLLDTGALSREVGTAAFIRLGGAWFDCEGFLTKFDSDF